MSHGSLLENVENDHFPTFEDAIPYALLALVLASLNGGFAVIYADISRRPSLVEALID